MGMKNCTFCAGHGYLVVVEIKTGEFTKKSFPKNFMDGNGKILPAHIMDANEFTSYCGGKNIGIGECTALFGVVTLLGCWHCKGRGTQED